MSHVQRQDAAAFEVLLDRHLVPLVRFLQRFTGNAADADDVAQETFLRVWRAAGSWQPGRVRFTTWLYRIGRNHAIDRHRRRRDETGHDLSLVPSTSTPDGELERTARDARVRAAVQALPERQRAALLLCHFQGLSNQEAALALEVSVEALESLLARARRTLKSRLIQDLGDSST